MKCELLGFLIPDKKGKMNWKQKHSQTNKWLKTTLQINFHDEREKWGKNCGTQCGQ